MRLIYLRGMRAELVPEKYLEVVADDEALAAAARNGSSSTTFTISPHWRLGPGATAKRFPKADQ